MRVDGKVVLITGASEGIGAACAAEFARYGAKLSLTARNEAGLARAGGSDALITPGDITQEATRRAAVERTLERFGQIDILINNAGIGLYTPSWRAPMDETRRMWEVNYFALLGMIQEVAPHMRARRSGTIVNVGSIGGKMTLPWLTLYSSTKYAIGSLTYVKTGFQKNVIGGAPPPDIQRSRKMAITPEQCASDIRRGVERGARTVLSPASGWLLVLLYRLFPGEAQRRMSGMLDRV
jgi:NADP-dependent 3-hydroxy acid dehydrogenase YdfG